MKLPPPEKNNKFLVFLGPVRSKSEDNEPSIAEMDISPVGFSGNLSEETYYVSFSCRVLRQMYEQVHFL